ncbi:phage tail protein [Marinomonas sp. PE14-40]|uniref:phage tail protein n=1 Tax=Marinomonas sp. PE14-40 TaxID=3060621 RepID=UPI003F66F302
MSEKYSLPVWIKGGAQVQALKTSIETMWAKVEGWLKIPLDQMDATTCHPYVLGLIAYQRDVTRFENESESIYRKRVDVAHKNLIDAGSKQGFERIFERLGIGYLELDERLDSVEWDVISLKVSDSQISTNTKLLDNIIRQYGRTCRRYELTVLTPVSIGVAVSEVGHVWALDVAREVISPWQADININSNESGHVWALDVASVS